MQRPAKPCTPVRFRPQPPHKAFIKFAALGASHSLCPGGEIGRRKGLKIPRGQPHASSILAPGTITQLHDNTPRTPVAQKIYRNTQYQYPRTPVAQKIYQNTQYDHALPPYEASYVIVAMATPEDCGAFIPHVPHTLCAHFTRAIIVRCFRN